MATGTPAYDPVAALSGERSDEFLEELARPRAARGHLLCAHMVTDIMTKGTKLLVAGEDAPLERIFGRPAIEGTIDLPGVMSRKKQVAPKLLAALRIAGRAGGTAVTSSRDQGSGTLALRRGSG